MAILRAYIILFLLGATTLCYAQYDKFAYELQTSAGVSIFLGDLGGGFGVGKAGFFDLDASALRPSSGAALRANIINEVSLRMNYTYALVYGDDSYSGDQGRRRRNLSFRSNIHEVSLIVEYSPYNFAKVMGRGSGLLDFYVFGGYGFFRFNPKAKLDNMWYELQPLSTEGQGVTNNSKPYKLTQPIVPVGFGWRKSWKNKWVIGLEFSFRRSFTDYIDDVSGQYPDVEQLRATKGDVAAQLSDRNTNQKASPGTFRGNPENNDNYSVIQFSMSRKLGAKNLSERKLNQRRKGVSCPTF